MFDEAGNEMSAVVSTRVCIDAVDVDRVTAFWAALFGYVVRDTGPGDDWQHLDASAVALPPLTIQPVPEGKTIKNRLHFDVFVVDPEPWITRAVALGATKLWLCEEPDDWFQVMADPEGNEFCFCLAQAPPDRP